MSRKRIARKFLGLLVIAAAGAGGYYYYQTQIGEETSVETETSYKETPVSYGSVVYGITESGSVSFGSNSQTLELPQAAETASGDSGSSGTDGETSDAPVGAMAGAAVSAGATDIQEDR